MEDAYRELETEIARFLAAPDAGPGDLLLRVFRFQFATNAPFRAYCSALGRTPDSVISWRDIPPVPAEAFKTNLPLTCVVPPECERVFLTSGTTSEVRGRHYLADLALYRAAVRRGWSDAGLPSGLPALFLSRAPSAVPDSSLTCMFEILAGDAPSASWLLDEGGHIATDRLEPAVAAEQPVLLFSTALALRHLFEQVPDGLPLPAGSWLFQTGGYKGLSEDYDPAALSAAIESILNVPADHVINEYGMTELSSQCYAIGLDSPHRAPPWMKVQIINPGTNAPVAPGETGYLALFDLANLNSVVAVRTQDFATAIDEHRFVLHGRDPGASPRGCSRASDAFLQRP